MWSVGGKVRIAGRGDEWLSNPVAPSSPVAPQQESQTSSDAARRGSPGPADSADVRSPPNGQSTTGEGDVSRRLKARSR
ncbi:MAG: hypothetical protein ABI614_01510 [Planctomycetota bacterium]